MSSELCGSISLEDLMVLESSASPLTRDTHRKLRHVHILPQLSDLLVSSIGCCCCCCCCTGECPAELRCGCFMPVSSLWSVSVLSDVWMLRLKLDRIRNTAAAAFASFLEASWETGAFDTWYHTEMKTHLGSQARGVCVRVCASACVCLCMCSCTYYILNTKLLIQLAK